MQIHIYKVLIHITGIIIEKVTKLQKFTISTKFKNQYKSNLSRVLYIFVGTVSLGHEATPCFPPSAPTGFIAIPPRCGILAIPSICCRASAIL